MQQSEVAVKFKLVTGMTVYLNAWKERYGKIYSFRCTKESIAHRFTKPEYAKEIAEKCIARDKDLISFEIINVQ